MPGIGDLIVYRGEGININPFKQKPSLSPFAETMKGRYSTISPKEAIRYASKAGFPNKVMSTLISPREAMVGARMFDEVVPEFKGGEMKPVKLKGRQLTDKLLRGPMKYVEEHGYNILNKKNKNLLKIDVLKTIASNAKALTPLAMKGLSYAASLPAQTILMTLNPTKANADEINMTLEDFAKLAKENNIEMGPMDKAIETESRDI